MTWEDLEQKGLPVDTKAVVNLAGRNVLDPLQRWTESFKKTVSVLPFLLSDYRGLTMSF